MPKRTYQPSKKRKIRKYGFRARTSTKKGRDVVKSRKLKGRYRLTY